MAPADDVLTSAGYLMLKAGHLIGAEFEAFLKDVTDDDEH